MKKIFISFARKLLVITAVLVVSKFSFAAEHKTNAVNPLTFTSESDISDEDFLKQAMLYHMKTVQISSIVAEQGNNSGIKAFAKSLINEQGKLGEELQVLAKSKNVSLPMSKPQGGQRPDGRIDSAPENLRDTSRNNNEGEATNSGQTKQATVANGLSLSEDEILATVTSLKAQKGSALNKTYLNGIIADHEAAIGLFNTASKSNDVAIKRFAIKHLPRLKANLAQAKALAKV